MHIFDENMTQQFLANLRERDIEIRALTLYQNREKFAKAMENSAQLDSVGVITSLIEELSEKK